LCGHQVVVSEKFSNKLTYKSHKLCRKKLRFISLAWDNPTVINVVTIIVFFLFCFQIICDENTNNITLHSKNLTISQKKVTLKSLGAEETRLEIEKVELVDEHDYIVIRPKQELTKGSSYELYIPFENDLNTGLLGYYKSSYTDRKTNEKVWLSVTQFEPTAARRAFPCFDEPEFKATFDISLGHNKKYTALSNMPLAKTEQLTGSSEEWVIDYFDRTVPMSTYLVAYTVNDFEYKEAKMEATEDVKFRIWARRDAIDQVDYASDVGPKVLRFYENYFDEKFPLPKIDMIAIPDFSAGAMENWGLIT
jgi:aminopeptidase N